MREIGFRAVRRAGALASALMLAMLAGVAVAQGQMSLAEFKLPPPVGPETPRVEPLRGDDGIYHQAWFVNSFLDFRDDYREAEQKGLRFAVVFEQRGCIYCTRMHTDVLARKYVNDYVQSNFHIIQLDLWGSREVTDFDGQKMPEKKLAERWGVLFTPTIVFFKDGMKEIKGWGQPLEVARMHLGFGAPTFYDMFTWVRAKVYEKDRNFQRFHLARTVERETYRTIAKK